MTQRDRNYAKFQRTQRNTQDRRERPKHEWMYNRDRSVNFYSRRPLGDYGDRRRSYHPYGEDYSRWNSNRRQDATDLPRRPFPEDRNVYPDNRHLAPASADLGMARNAIMSPVHVDEPMYRIGTCAQSNRYAMGPQESFAEIGSSGHREQSSSRYLDHPEEKYSIDQIRREPSYRDAYANEDHPEGKYPTGQMRREPNYRDTYSYRRVSREHDFARIPQQGNIEIGPIRTYGRRRSISATTTAEYWP